MKTIIEAAKNVIEFRIIRITEEHFIQSFDEISGLEFSNELLLQIGFHSKLKIEDDMIDIHIRAEYKKKNSEGTDVQIMLLSIINTFNIKNIGEYFKNNGDGNDQDFEGNKDLMHELLRISIGALRGALAMKTAGTTLSECPLPIVSVSELFPEY